MPKEVIRGREFNVVVGWSQHCGVQVATEMREPQDSDAPQNLEQLVATWGDGTKAHARGLYSDLDRQQINELIRVLRRARDSAFGRDE